MVKNIHKNTRENTECSFAIRIVTIIGIMWWYRGLVMIAGVS